MPPLGLRRKTEIASDSVCWIGSFYLVILYMGLGRPIWYDEFLQFAVAGERSSGEAWSLIRRSILGINHNQTGIYLMIDYWLETIGGASSLLLRLPSEISGFMFFLFVIKLFRTLGYPSYWSVLAVIALMGQNSALYYIGEARPYFPLAAAALGSLLYYLPPPEERKGWLAFFGWVAIISGCLFHPYYIVYWGAIIFITFVRLRAEEQTKFDVPSLTRHVDLPLCTIGGLIYIILASATWLRHSPSFKFDPFTYLKPSVWESFVNNMHFEFMSPHIAILVFGTILTTVLLVPLSRQRRGSIRGLAGPYMLICGMITVSLVVAIASYMRHYWIIPRQWVASASILPVAFVWLWAELGRIYSKILPVAYLIFWFVPALLMFDAARGSNQELWENLIKNTATARTSTLSCAPQPPAPDPQAAQKWVELANNNIDCGGPVWTVFKSYYDASTP